MVKKNHAAIIAIIASIFLLAPYEEVFGQSGKGGYSRSGTYKFRSSTGKPYIGKSNDMSRRLNEHTKSGKLKKEDLSTVKIQKYELGKGGLRNVEATKIRSEDILSNGGLANKQHAPLSRNVQKMLQQ